MIEVPHGLAHASKNSRFSAEAPEVQGDSVSTTTQRERESEGKGNHEDDLKINLNSPF